MTDTHQEAALPSREQDILIDAAVTKVGEIMEDLLQMGVPPWKLIGAIEGLVMGLHFAVKRQMDELTTATKEST